MGDALLAGALEALTPAQSGFLAGLVCARGGLYVTSSQRANGASRLAPVFQLELPEPLTEPALVAVLGEPATRRYYGRPQYRYAVQDRAKIAQILIHVRALLPAGMIPTLDAMIDVCTGDEAARARGVAVLTGGKN